MVNTFGMFSKISHLLLMLGCLFVLTCCKSAKTFTTPKTNITVAHTVIKTSDGGIVVAGVDQKNIYHSRGWVNEGKGVITKLDESGNLIWEKQPSFLKYSTVNDLLETNRQELLILNKIRHDYQGGRGEEMGSYLTKLDENGNQIFQKKIDGDLRKMQEAENGDLLIVGLGKSRFKINVFVFELIVVCIDEQGNLKWKQQINEEINSIDDLKLNNYFLEVHCSLYGSENIKRSIFNFDINNRLIEKDKDAIAPYLITLDNDGRSISFVNKSSEREPDWALQLENHNTGEQKELPLKQYAKLPLVPQIRLERLHVCTQLGESPSDANQILRMSNGDLYITALVVEDLDRENEASLSTQAYCHGNIKGFLLIKLDSNYKIKWIEFIASQAIPMDLINVDNEKLMVVGTKYHQINLDSTKVDPKGEKMFIFIINKNGRVLNKAD